MTRLRIGILAAGVLTAAGVSVATAQSDKMLRPPAMQAEAIIYRDANYQGPAVNVSQPEGNLGLAWRVNSVRVRSGEWQLCERPNFRGNCRNVNRDTPVFAIRGITVQSMRPTGNGGGSGGWQQPGEPGNNPSLRGMAAQFYSAPAERGYRLLACEYGSATASCTRQTAERFCSRMGWRTSARQSMETVRGRVYLADVLCSNTGN
ncbi:MAG: beta/gamma crystallin-related protein [Erythrobacter sp.]